jgi:ferredoxin
VTERLSRTERRRILKDDERWLHKPLDLSSSRRGAEAHTRHLAIMLADTAIKDRATKAAEYASQILDAALAKELKPPIACKKGCDYCCKTLVTATIPEILRMAGALRGKEAKVLRVNAAAERSRGIPQIERNVRTILCGVVEERMCSEYAARPLLCRAAYSTDVDACIRIFDHASSESFPYEPNSVELRRRVVVIMQAALMINKLPHYYYELSEGLSAALALPDAEERWLSGEPVFAKVAINMYEHQNVSLNAAGQRLAEVVKATL